METKSIESLERAGLTRRQSVALLAGLGALLPAGLAHSQQVIRIIVPSGAGSATDATARALQNPLAKILGGSAVVENIAGASGLIGMQALARATPTDQVFVVVTNNVVILPSVMKAFTFDVSTDFTPITMIAAIPILLVANSAKVSAKNAKEMAAYLNSKNGTVNFGSSGVGSTYHLSCETFLDAVGAKATHVPYRSPAPSFTAVIAGEIEFAAMAASFAEPHIKSGAIHAIGAFSEKRTAVAPDVATFVEQGYPDCLGDAWATFLAPKGMDAAAIKKLHEAVVAAINDPATKDMLNKQGSVLQVTSPEQTKKLIAEEQVRYAALVKKIGLKPE